MIAAFVAASVITLLAGLLGELNTMIISACLQFGLAVAAVIAGLR